MYFCGEGVSVDAMLRSVAVLRSVVQKDFLDLVTIRQRAVGYVNGQLLLGSGFRPEHQRLARVVQRSGNLAPSKCANPLKIISSG